MSATHIIVMFEIFVLLIGIYFVARVHVKESLISKEGDFIDRFINQRDEKIKKSGTAFSIEWYLRTMLIAPLLLGILVYLPSKNIGLALIVGAFGLIVPELVIKYLEHSMKAKFEDRFARSLEQMASSLRAGMSISQAVEDVANCKFLHESMRKKYAKLSSDLQMGLTVSEAFARFAAGTNNQDAEDVALAIDVQNKVGGHESEVVEEIANNIHDRIMLRREIKSIFSDTSSMIYMMDLIVPLVIVVFSVVNPQYIMVYFSSPVFIILLILLLVLPLIGSVINHRILNKIKKGA